MPREEKAIDEILETLYALDVQGYVLDENVMKSAAVKRINRTLDRIARGKKTVQDETNYRLEQFEKFSKMEKRQRDEIIQIAKEKHISLEEAYKLAMQ